MLAEGHIDGLFTVMHERLRLISELAEQGDASSEQLQLLVAETDRIAQGIRARIRDVEAARTAALLSAEARKSYGTAAALGRWVRRHANVAGKEDGTKE